MPPRSTLRTPIYKSTVVHSNTSSSWRLAALACIRAAPRFFLYTPAIQPIGKACIAVVGRQSGCGQRCTTVALTRAALSVDFAAPHFLADRPACLPVRKAIGTIVRVCWSWRLCWLTALVMVGAAPCLLIWFPSRPLSHSTVERINWSWRWCGPCRNRCWWRRWWWCRRRKCWGCCGGLRRSTSPSNRRAAKLLLLL